MNSRFNLGLRPATASSDALLNRKADGIDGNAPAYPDRFTFGTPLVPAEASHSSLFALSSRQERNFRPFVFNHLHTLFHSLQRSDTPSRFFSIASTLFARVPGTRPPPHQIRPPSQPRLGQRCVLQHRPGKRTGSGRCSLFACLYLVTSLLRPCTRRNLIRRLIILWRRDTEPILVTWVYTPVSGFVFDALA